MSNTKWRNYEEVAEYLLNQMASKFQLGQVQGKQVMPGASGAEWEIDAKGCAIDGESYVVVECKRYTTSRLPQSIAGSLAYTIKDLGADGGILVSPLGLQSGAKKIAKSESITEVVLSADSTKTDYVLKFLNQVHYGKSAQVNVSIRSSLTMVVRDKDGNIIETREAND